MSITLYKHKHICTSFIHIVYNETSQFAIWLHCLSSTDTRYYNFAISRTILVLVSHYCDTFLDNSQLLRYFSTDHMILKIPVLLLLSVSVQTRAPGTNCTGCPKDNCTEWPILLYRVSHITVQGVKNNTITQKICEISSDSGLFVSILRTKYLFLVNFNNFEHLVHVQ